MNNFMTDTIRQIFIIIDLFIIFGIAESAIRWYKEHKQ